MIAWNRSFGRSLANRAIAQKVYGRLPPEVQRDPFIHYIIPGPKASGIAPAPWQWDGWRGIATVPRSAAELMHSNSPLTGWNCSC